MGGRSSGRRGICQRRHPVGGIITPSIRPISSVSVTLLTHMLLRPPRTRRARARQTLAKNIFPRAIGMVAIVRIDNHARSVECHRFVHPLPALSPPHHTRYDHGYQREQRNTQDEEHKSRQRFVLQESRGLTIIATGPRVYDGGYPCGFSGSGHECRDCFYLAVGIRFEEDSR